MYNVNKKRRNLSLGNVPMKHVLPIREFRQTYGPVQEAPDELSQPHDRPVVAALCKHLKAKSVLEFGVHIGRMAKFILDRCPDVQNYVGIDVPSGFVGADTNYNHAAGRIGCMVKGDSRFSVLLCPQGTEKLDVSTLSRFDFIYIDADHTYQGVLRDTELAMLVVAHGGIIAWHDYTNPATPDVTRFLEELAEKRELTVVPPSWISFAQF